MAESDELRADAPTHARRPRPWPGLRPASRRAVGPAGWVRDDGSGSTGPSAEVGRGAAADLLGLARPRQWSKNVFVLAPLVFGGQMGRASAWVATAAALACFCLWSSALYAVNDVLDAEADRRHPRKRRRPVASGRVSPALALAWSAGLAGAATAAALATLPAAVAGLGWLYALNGLLYCTVLKHRAIVDVLSIAAGFVVRLLAGCAAIGVEPSSWVIVCGFSLALLLGFGKRRLEVQALDRAGDHRRTLRVYAPETLNLLLSTTASMCLLSYALYTVAPETIARHGTTALIYTTPFVFYGVFRYILKVQEGRHDGPVEVLMSDPIFAINGALWVVTSAAILAWNRPTP